MKNGTEITRHAFEVPGTSLLKSLPILFSISTPKVGTLFLEGCQDVGKKSMLAPLPHTYPSTVSGLEALVTCGSGFPCRHRKNNEKAQEASDLLKDNLELQNFLQNCQEVRLQPGWPLCRRFPLEAWCPGGGKSFLTQESGFHKQRALGS